MWSQAFPRTQQEKETRKKKTHYALGAVFFFQKRSAGAFLGKASDRWNVGGKMSRKMWQTTPDISHRYRLLCFHNCSLEIGVFVKSRWGASTNKNAWCKGHSCLSVTSLIRFDLFLNAFETQHLPSQHVFYDYKRSFHITSCQNG